MNKEEICNGNCDKCEHGVPIDGQYYEDGLPIHECSIPVEKNLRDKKGADK